jgi:hypothetical protein
MFFFERELYEMRFIREGDLYEIRLIRETVNIC